MFLNLCRRRKRGGRRKKWEVRVDGKVFSRSVFCNVRLVPLKRERANEEQDHRTSTTRTRTNSRYHLIDANKRKGKLAELCEKKEKTTALTVKIFMLTRLIVRKGLCKRGY